jgi:pimeloyl-ACP methyl ester carboxylesterase
MPEKPQPFSAISDGIRGVYHRAGRRPDPVALPILRGLLIFILAAPLARAQEAGPLVLAKSSYFFVGGKIDPSVEGSPMVGQMYVEYMIPQRLLHPYPVVMVHGGNQTGTNFTGTPDGREGWAQYFVRRGYSVYVVDQVARGRSPYWSQVYGALPPARLAFVEQRFVAPELTPMWPQAHLHNQFPGDGRPGDANFDQFYASQFPSIASFPRQQELNRDALVALLDKIGPAILLTHSQAGAFGWPVADARPDLVKAILAIEPNGPPFYQVEFKGAPDWFKQGTLALPYGITAAPLNYSPPIKDASELKMVQQDKADTPDLVRCYAQAEPARQLPNLQKMPILVLTAEASYHAPYDHCTVNYLRQAGVKPTYIRLADIGIKGNSHVMMLEKNSKDIAGVIARWLDKALTPP